MNEPRRLPHGRRRASLPPPEEKRLSAASLLLIGLIIGLAGALYYAWLVDPVIYVDASPSRLRDDFKAEYIFLVSQSYAADGDWPRAQRRLNALADPDIGQAVAAELERALRQGESAAKARNLALLAAQLGVNSPAVAIFAPTPAAPPVDTPTPTLVAPTPTPTISPTPPPTLTPTATATATAVPSPTPRPAYRLLSQERVCPLNAPAPRIEVVTVNAFLQQEPGVAILVSWEGGLDRFYTGFQPELGAGYGDFLMSPDISYSVVLEVGSPAVSGLQIELCQESGLPGGWRLTFQNLGLPTPTPTP
jgi:hypothetical protein